MNVALPALLLLLAGQAGAQSFVSMGRLFTTPGERVQLDTQRNQAQMAPGGASGHAGAPGSLAGVGQPWPGAATAQGVGPAGAHGGPGMDASAGCPPGSAPGCPPPAPAPGATATMPGMAGADGGAGADGAGAGAQAEAPPGLRLDGIVRRSQGRTMVIVNGEVQPAPPGGVTRGAVRLQADGRSVVLKPGQRYDPSTGEIHEAAR